MKIMRGNEKAKYLRTTYVDGFAGSGRRYGDDGSAGQEAFQDFMEPDTKRFYIGSVERALRLEPPFDQYLFIEQKAAYADELEDLTRTFTGRTGQVTVRREDVNVAIPEWCHEMQSKDRALVFLDPYGMQVNWSTVEALAKTQKVDLWILVPLGQAVIRLLTEKRPPQEWGQRLTAFFGEDAWQHHFYVKTQAGTLFDDEPEYVRNTDYEKITGYMVQRFKTIFAGVLKSPIILRNSRGVPLYLLCFAASNPAKANLAVKIASDIAKGFQDG